MKTGTVASALVVLLLGGGLLLWSGCGAGSKREASAPSSDGNPPGDAAPSADGATPTDSTSSGEETPPSDVTPPGDSSAAATDSSGSSTSSPVSAAPDNLQPPTPSDEVWIEPPAGGTEGEDADSSYQWAESSGRNARMGMPLEKPIEEPAAPPLTLENPIRQPGVTAPVAVSPVNPVRQPAAMERSAPRSLMTSEPSYARESGEDTPVYRMAAPPDEPSESRMQPLMSPLVEGPGGAATAINDLAPDMAPPEEAGPVEPAPEAAPAPGAIADTAGDEGKTAVEPDTGEDPNYKLVNVFYGTDRNAVSGAAALGPIYSSGWFMLTAIAAGISLLLMIVALWIARSRVTFVLMGLGMMATCALAAVTVLDYLQAKASTASLERTYGDERGQLELGTCQVSIPKRHEVGQVERPSLLRGEVYEDPRLHVVLLTVNLEDEDRFYSGLRARVERSKEKEAFVFVHGFNVTFAEAARRTAQLAYDLDFDGAPIFFSWPSQGGLLKYAVDETNVVWAVPHLKQFLVGVARQSGATSVHLIAHSMGNRALTSALESIASDMQDEQPIFREVLLTAPDIDADVFKRDVAPAIVRTADRVTLYASSNDEALKLSKEVHGYPRAGDSGPGLVIVPGIDTIDVSTVDTSLLGHSYYGSNDTVIADMVDLLHEAKPPEQRRWLQPQHLGQMLYWIFSPQRLGVLSAPAEPAVR